MGQSSPQEKTMDHVKNIAHVFQSECLTKLVFVSQVRAKFLVFQGAPRRCPSHETSSYQNLLKY